MKRFFLVTGLASILFILAAVPSTSFAASKSTFLGPIVPEECHCKDQPNPAGEGKISTAPDYGCVLQTVQNTINFAVTLSTILFVLYSVLAAFQLILSGGSGEARSKAKTRILNVVIGLTVLLMSWLIVDYVMKTLYNSDGFFGPWNSILAGDTSGKDRCIIPTKPSAITEGTVGILFDKPDGTYTGSQSGGGNGAGGGSCTPIPDSELTSIGNGFKIKTANAAQFKNMQAAAAKDGITLTPTSGYRSPEHQTNLWNEKRCTVVSGKAVCPQTTAAIPCSLGGNGSNHTRGTAVDIRLTPGVYAWLHKNGGTYGFYNKLANDTPHWSDTGY